MKTKERLKPLSFLAPALIIYFIIIVFPTFYSVILSFFDWNGISEKKFIGIKNYVNLFTNDAVFRIALKNNIIWIVLTVCITVVLALLLALVLNNRFKGRIVYRSIFYFPYMLSWIIVGIIWKWMYNPNFGMINTCLLYTSCQLHKIDPELFSTISQLFSFSLFSNETTCTSVLYMIT